MEVHELVDTLQLVVILYVGAPAAPAHAPATAAVKAALAA